MTNQNEINANMAIRDVLHLYCRAYDRYDRELALRVFDVEGRAHYPGLPEMTAAQLVDTTFQMNKEAFFASSHQITSSLIEVNGETGKSESYGVARALGKDAKGLVVEHNWSTRYLDDWCCRDGKWRIGYRRAIIDCYTILNTGAAPIEIPNLDPGLMSRPDRSDPVYANE